MLKKSLAVGIIFFLVISSVPYSILSNEISTGTFDGNTLYVGGTGPGNYSKIQDAIDNASNGDMVFVYEGIYFENVIVDKSINLIGAERNATIIYGKNNSMDNSFIITIKDDNVTVSEFTLSPERNLRGIFIEGSDSHLLTNISIINNTIIRPNFGYSICIFYARNIYISSNILYGVFGAGYCINVTVYSNEIRGYCIECVMALSINFIKNNLFLDYPYGPMVKYLIFQPWEVIKYPWYNVKFNNNYFGRACIFPKPIIFLAVYPIPNTHPEVPIILPWLIFDWHPAKEPYDIPAGGA